MEEVTIGAVGKMNFTPGKENIPAMLAQPLAVSPSPWRMMTVALCSPLASKMVGSGYDRGMAEATPASLRCRESNCKTEPSCLVVCGLVCHLDDAHEDANEKHGFSRQSCVMHTLWLHSSKKGTLSCDSHSTPDLNHTN